MKKLSYIVGISAVLISAATITCAFCFCLEWQGAAVIIAFHHALQAATVWECKKVLEGKQNGHRIRR